MERPIIQIDEERCDGCGQCVLACAEGALAIRDGKARLISDTYCDGLGACLSCPRDALKLVVRDAPDFDEAAALAAKAARTDIPKPHAGGCPGSAARVLNPAAGQAPPVPLASAAAAGAADGGSVPAVLPSWPLQLRLLPPTAPFLRGARILLAAHCSGFALPNLHADWLAGRIPVIACPKLDDAGREYLPRLTAILRGHADAPPVSIDVLRMSVPCCSGLEHLARAAVREAGPDIPIRCHVVRLG